MENQVCVVENYVVEQTSKIGVTVKGMEKIKYAEKIKDTANGAYYMKGLHNEMIAVFKPNKEEVSSAGKKKGYKADREVAAFILDHPALEGAEGFGSVPQTSFVRAKYFDGKITTDWERGSLQQYIPNQKWNRKPEVFSIDDVQRLSLTDMRFGNNDRHCGNILLNSNIKRGKLVPIDHGECFPMEWNNYSFIWTTWSQADTLYPCYMVDYVRNLDVEKDLHILKENGIELGEKSIFSYKIQNKVLKAGVLGGYTPKEIGNFMIKVYGNKERTLINVMDECRSRQPGAGSEEESQLLELVHEETKIALAYNKSLPKKDLKGSTSRY